MATLKRQRADGTYELVEMYGKFIKLKELYIAQSDNITTIPIQNSYTKVTDIINVYCEGLKLVENENFTISVDNRTIELKDWAIKTGDKIEIEIYKNAIDIDMLASGSQLEDFSIDKIKLSQALQDEISNGGNAVKSVNNVLPDGNGNVQVDTSYVIISPKLPESIDYKDGFTFFQPSKTLDAPTGVNYQQAWYDYLATQFPHIISDSDITGDASHSIKVFTFYRYISGKGTTSHEKIRHQEIHIVSPTYGIIYKFERLYIATAWSIKMTYDFKKPSIKSVNNILPDENGNVNIEMQGGGNSFFKSYNLPTTTVGQKVWSLPVNSYDANADSIAVFYNGDLINDNEYMLTGDAINGYQINIENPIEEVEDNNVTVIVLRNARSDEPNKMSGLLLTDDSVAMNKLGQDVKDAIANAGSKVDIIDDLTSSRTDAVVSARVSKMIYDEIGYIDNRIDDHSLEKASSTSTGHVKPDDITTKVDATGKISVITANDFTGGVDKVASAEIIKTLKGQVDTHIGDSTIHITTAQKNQLHAGNAIPLVDGRSLVNGVEDIITLNPTQLRDACASYIRYGKVSFFTNLASSGLGSTYGSYGILTVDIPWTDNSGGFIFVTVETATATLKRYESSPTSWTAWKITQSSDVDVAQLFQSVSDGKSNLATAITGKGVITSADATFATMVANINNIPSGIKYYETTISGNVAQKKFYSVSGSLITNDFNFITITIPFNPSLVHVRSIRTGDYFAESYYTSFSDGFTTGTVKMAQYNGLQVNGSNLNMKPYTTNIGNGSWLYEIPVLNYNTTYTVRAYG